jgi:hypothetical protein
VSMPDGRTVGELLADSEALARETLLDAARTGQVAQPRPSATDS